MYSHKLKVYRNDVLMCKSKNREHIDFTLTI